MTVTQEHHEPLVPSPAYWPIVTLPLEVCTLRTAPLAGEPLPPRIVVLPLELVTASAPPAATEAHRLVAA